MVQIYVILAKYFSCHWHQTVTSSKGVICQKLTLLFESVLWSLPPKSRLWCMGWLAFEIQSYGFVERFCAIGMPTKCLCPTKRPSRGNDRFLHPPRRTSLGFLVALLEIYLRLLLFPNLYARMDSNCIL